MEKISVTCPECGRRVHARKNKFGDWQIIHHDRSVLLKTWWDELGHFICDYDGEDHMIGQPCKATGMVVGAPVGGKTRY